MSLYDLDDQETTAVIGGGMFVVFLFGFTMWKFPLIAGIVWIFIAVVITFSWYYITVQSAYEEHVYKAPLKNLATYEDFLYEFRKVNWIIHQYQDKYIVLVDDVDSKKCICDGDDWFEFNEKKMRLSFSDFIKARNYVKSYIKRHKKEIISDAPKERWTRS